MDKETLSNYGWVVIVLIVLALMISLATPFASELTKNVKDSTLKFMNVASTALENVTKYEGFDEISGGSGGGPGGGSSGEVEEPPVLLSGDGQEVNKAEENPFVFRSSAAYDTFKEVRVDGEVVDGSNYTVSEGSTVITFKWEFAVTLTVGNHTISIVSKSGSANGVFDVVEKEHVNAETGEILDSWDVIIDSVNDGSYKTKYAIRNYKSLDLGSEGVINMQIAAFDTDVLSDGSGNAHITWVAKELLKTKHSMNSSGTNANGWAASEMRTYLQNNVWALIPATVQNSIVAVDKTYYNYTTGSTLTSSDKVWIPSWREVGLGTDLENGGVIYGELFTDNSSRVKTLNGSSDYWWLRSAHSSGSIYFRNVSSSGGGVSGSNGNDTRGVALSFCM